MEASKAVFGERTSQRGNMDLTRCLRLAAVRSGGFFSHSKGLSSGLACLSCASIEAVLQGGEDGFHVCWAAPLASRELPKQSDELRAVNGDGRGGRWGTAGAAGEHVATSPRGCVNSCCFCCMRWPITVHVCSSSTSNGQLRLEFVEDGADGDGAPRAGVACHVGVQVTPAATRL